MKLQLDQLGKRFNRQWLFREISIEVPALSSLAITGPNGSGKSTLLQIVYQYVVPTTGKVTAYLDQECISPEQLVHHTAFVAPYLELPEELTLIELVRFHFGMRNFTGVIAEEAIAACGLQGNEHKYVRFFSSGMKQRLKLSLAFFSNCRLLLLDEPCSNLDQQGINWYLQMIEKRKSDTTILVASNQEIEYGFCDKHIRIA